MMAKSEDARLTFMKDSHSLQTLTKLLHSYIQLDSLVRYIFIIILFLIKKKKNFFV